MASVRVDVRMLVRCQETWAGMCKGHATVCPPVRGDTTRALACALSPVQADKYGLTILYHPHQCKGWCDGAG